MDLADILAATPLCRQLSPDEVLRISEAGRIEYWPEGSLVLEEGTHGPRMIVVLEGHVQVRKRDRAGSEHVLDELGPGAVLGEMSLLLQQPRSATVLAETALRVFAIEQSVFLDLAAQGDPAALKLGFALARMLASRLDALNRKAVELLETADDDALTRLHDAISATWDPEV